MEVCQFPAFYSLNASVERPGTSKEIKEKALYSIYGKVGLSWKSAIYVDLTARNDWSSTLPSDSRSYFYPSVSGSFIPTAFYNPLEEVLEFLEGSCIMDCREKKIYLSMRSIGCLT